MDSLGIKTTLYDILGYLVPGISVITGIWFISLPVDHQNTTYVNGYFQSWQIWVFLSIAGYITGHVVSTFSYLIFENKISTCILNYLYPFKSNKFDSGAKKHFNKPYSELDSRVPAIFCQTYFRDSYSTAFVFLSIYGFSRNILMSLMIVWAYSGFSKIWSIPYWAIIIFLLLLFINYIRFKRYFEKQIAATLLMPLKDDQP